jgi:diacylglycerol kinase (ATP)
MRVTLVHNPTAGDEEHSAEALAAMIARAGHEVSSWSAKEDDWKHAVDSADVVVAAGGDGTVGKVFRRLAGGPVPAALLPVGSANNVATALSVAGADIEQLIAAWETAPVVRYELGRALVGGDEACFVESSGGGLFAEAIAHAQDAEDEPGDKVELGLRTLRGLVGDLEARTWQLELDGAGYSGELLAVEVMVIGISGPNMALAPEADPCDGLLDVVLVTDRERPRLAAYLDERLDGGLPEPLDLPVLRARTVTMRPPAEAALRLDDDLCEGAEVVAASGPAVRLLLPPKPSS